ncbi:MAG: glycosyltransferase family 39 protein [Methanobacteriaceae archaeon]|nr:glycosyltransferase family 39 protein [Methanobacteriaceae archaeon]
MIFDKIKNDKYLQFIILFSIFITIALIYINSTTNFLGIYFVDPYFYLIQALRYAGYDIGGYAFINYFPPLVPFLTSLLFRLGIVGDYSIFLVTGIFYIPAVIGVYALLKYRFDEQYAFIGALFYGSISVNIMWVANGTIDIPSVAFSIWAFYTFILAIEKNQKYFYLSIPLVVLSFFAKYIGVLVIFGMLMYVLSKKDIFSNIAKYIKHFIGGVIVSFIFIIPFLAHYYINKIPFGFLNQASNIASTTTTSVSSATIYVPPNDLLFYLFFIPRFVCKYIPIVGIPILIILIMVVAYVLYRLKDNLKRDYKTIPNKINLSFFNRIKLSKNVFYGIIILSIILFALSFLLAGTISFITCELIFFIGIMLFSISFNSIYDNGKYEFFNFDIATYTWFFSYLIFFSAHLIKADRYFIIHAPSFTIIIIFGLTLIIRYLHTYSKNYDSLKASNRTIDNIKVKLVIWNKKYKLTQLIPVIFVILCLISSLGYLAMDKHDTLVDDEKQTALWIKGNLPDNVTLCADRGPIFTWYLQKGVVYNKDSIPINNMSTFLKDNNASYYISLKGFEIQNLTIVKHIGKVTIYKNMV